MSIVQACPSVPSWTFIHGILIGQGSIFILVILFLKYVVFEDPEIFRLKSLSRDKINLSNRNKKSTYLPPPIPSPHSTTSSILSKLSYDLPTHAPESLDWLNILNAQMLSSYRNLILQSKTGNGGAKGLMEEILNRASGNESTGSTGGEGVDGEGDGGAGGGLIGVDRIRVGEVELGDKFPILSNARVRPSSSEDGAVRIELDLDYTDHVSLSLSTSVLINFPRPRFAILPISLSLTLSRFSGTLTLELPHLSSLPTSLHPSTAPHPVLHFSLHPDFTLQLSITSLLGSRAKLQDIPKVEQLILGRIRGFIQDRVVWPGRVEVGLPGLLEEVIRDALASADGQGEGEGIEGLEGEDWEWVEGSSIGSEEGNGGAPNADSDDGEGGYSPTLSRARPRFARTRKEEEEGEATLDLTADGGPSVYLRPKIRKRPIIHGSGSGGRRSSTSSEGDALISSNLNLNINGTATTTGIKNNLFNFPTNNHSPMLGFPNSLPPPLPPTFISSNHSHLNNTNGNPTLMPWELSRPPSPTESLPGFFRMDNRGDGREELISGGGAGINGKGIYANRSTSGGGGMRYRAGGVGL